MVRYDDSMPVENLLDALAKVGVNTKVDGADGAATKV